MPCANASGTISPHPCPFTRVVFPSTENGRSGSRLVTSTGTSSGRRVLRRIACCVFSEGLIKLVSKAFFGPKTLDLKSGAGGSDNTYPRSMLDHREAPGTVFRGPGFQLDTRDRSTAAPMLV